MVNDEIRMMKQMNVQCLLKRFSVIPSEVEESLAIPAF
jgi:hypothetical protein